MTKISVLMLALVMASPVLAQEAAAPKATPVKLSEIDQLKFENSILKFNAAKKEFDAVSLNTSAVIKQIETAYGATFDGSTGTFVKLASPKK